MNYQISRTDKFNDQLHAIIQYIASDSGDVDTALRYLDTVESAVLRLKAFPESGSIPRYSLLRRQGYRVLIVERHLIFYKVDKGNQRVVLYAVVDSRMEYVALV
jgi:toxin ParE1/3/4